MLSSEMLSPESTAVVKATAGVVAENSVEITTRFYPHMFAAHPELMRVFNKANQAIGEQPRALAASVVAYAVNLIDPNAPDFGPVMRRIAHKHVSLGIKSYEYPIVGHHLMWAVGDVLGDASNRVELVQCVIEANRSNGRSGDRRQQGTTKRVAQGVTETRLERFDDELRPVLGDDLFGQRRSL